jgi:hypothetical protein
MFNQQLFTVGANVMAQAKPTMQFKQVNKPTGRTMPMMSAAKPMQPSAQVQMSIAPRSNPVTMSL